MSTKPMPVLTREVVKQSAEHIKGHVLDLGAGSAKYKPDIMKYADEYTAYDMVPGEHIDIVGDVHNLEELPDNSFDTVVCTEVLEHVKEPWVVVEEICRVLKPGGRCVLTAPFLLPFHADPYDYYRYTIEGFSHLCSRTGMTVVKSAKIGNLPLVLAEGFKFSFNNPYVHTNPGFMRRNIFRVVYKFLSSVKRQSTIKGIFYTGSYVVAEKTL